MCKTNMQSIDKISIELYYLECDVRKFPQPILSILSSTYLIKIESFNA